MGPRFPAVVAAASIVPQSRFPPLTIETLQTPSSHTAFFPGNAAAVRSVRVGCEVFNGERKKPGLERWTRYTLTG